MASISPRSVAPSALKVLRETSKALRKMKQVDPRERYVLLYPDSDNVYSGMAEHILNVPEAEEVFDKASEIVKKNLFKMCLDPSNPELFNSLENKQIATFVTSHATVTKLAHQQPNIIQFCKAAGGVGVGFINTLVFSGALSFENGLDLVQRQAQAMDKAASIVPSARLKVRLLPATRKSVVCRAAAEHCLKQGIPPEIAICSISKQSRPHLVEISGHEAAIRYLEEEGERLFGFRWAARVKKTPHAYNSPLMRPAQDFLSLYIDQRIKDDPDYLKDPVSCSVYTSTAGRRLRLVKYIKTDLINYPVRPVGLEPLLTCLYCRPPSLAQPNTFVVWDTNLLRTLMHVNRRAWLEAKLLK